MGQRCQICAHPERARIELALARRVPVRTIGAHYDLHHDAVHRHRKNHLPPQVEMALKAAGKPSDIDVEALRKSESEGLLQHLLAQRGRLYHLADMAEEVKDVRAAAQVHGRITSNLQLTAQLLGELAQHSTTTVNQLIVSPEYADLRSALIRALQPFPQARQAVAKVLREIEGGEPHWTGVPKSTPMIESKDHAGT